MNEHEIERIAAATHQLRPDWPVASLKTLIAKKLGDRPRRDVCVALAWIACEANTATPARVLEAGPWWRAAAIEGGGAPRNQIPAHERCSTCSKSAVDCARVRFADDDHIFEPATVDNKRGPDAIHQIVEHAKGELQATRPRPAPAVHTTNPDGPAARARKAAAEDTNEGDAA